MVKLMININHYNSIAKRKFLKAILIINDIMFEYIFESILVM